MSVEPIDRKSGRVWRVRWRDNNGAQRSKVLGRKADAIAYDAEIRKRKRTGDLEVYEAGEETLGAFAAGDWWRLYAEPHLAERTRDSYSKIWDRHVLPYLGAVPLRELRAPDIEEHLAGLRSIGVGAPTVHRVYLVLSSVLQRAFEWGRVPENPCRRVRSRAPKRERVVVPLTDEQIDQLRKACLTPRDGFIIGMMAYGGFRPSELCALTWADIGPDYIDVTKATAPKGGIKDTKTHVDRRVKMTPKLIEVYDEYVHSDAIELTHPHAPVITTRQGKPFKDSTWTTWHKDVWRPICEATGIKAVPYDLRHTFVSRLIAEGMNVVEVAKQAGNSPVTTLTVYSHLFDE